MCVQHSEHLHQKQCSQVLLHSSWSVLNDDMGLCIVANLYSLMNDRHTYRNTHVHAPPTHPPMHTHMHTHTCTHTRTHTHAHTHTHTTHTHTHTHTQTHTHTHTRTQHTHVRMHLLYVLYGPTCQLPIM